MIIYTEVLGNIKEIEKRTKQNKPGYKRLTVCFTSI